MSLYNVTEILLQKVEPEFPHNFHKSCYCANDFMVLWKIRMGTETRKYLSGSMSETNEIVVVVAIFVYKNGKVKLLIFLTVGW